MSSKLLEFLSEEFARDPARAQDFYDCVLEGIWVLGGETGLSPELAEAVVRNASLDELTGEGWGCIWMELCTWLPAGARPGGSWRIRAARAAAAREGSNFGEQFSVRPRDAGAEDGPMGAAPTWTGNFLSPWAPAGLAHLEDFEPGERREFLALMPRADLERSVQAWKAEAELDGQVAAETALDRGQIVRRRELLLSAARAALEGSASPAPS